MVISFCTISISLKPSFEISGGAVLESQIDYYWRCSILHYILSITGTHFKQSELMRPGCIQTLYHHEHTIISIKLSYRYIYIYIYPYYATVKMFVPNRLTLDGDMEFL